MAAAPGDKLDIIGELPPELASMILRMLEGDCLCQASLVSKRWLELCKTDSVLRRRIFETLRRRRLQDQRMLLLVDAVMELASIMRL